MISKKTLWLCFGRTWSIGSAMSTRGMQRVGLLHALDPALQEIHNNPEDLYAARRRYLGNVRTHTILASLLVGLCIALEKDIASQKIPTTGFDKLLSTTATTLSAIGDSFFSGSLLVFWALLSALSIVWGQPHLIIAFTLIFGLFTFFFRVSMYVLSLKKGLMILDTLRKINLINWADVLKRINALLVVVFLGKMCYNNLTITWYKEFLAILCLMGLAYFLYKVHVPRVFLMSVFLVLCLV